jgi:hypothetical protein
MKQKNAKNTDPNEYVDWLRDLEALFFCLDLFSGQFKEWSELICDSINETIVKKQEFDPLNYIQLFFIFSVLDFGDRIKLIRRSDVMKISR